MTILNGLKPWEYNVKEGFTLRGYYTPATGKPVIHFIHGNGFCGLTYEHLLAHLQQDFDLFISGPFGQGSSRLIGNQHQASLTLPGKEPVQAPSADYLMAQYLGWTFPVLDIRYWVKGQASPNSPSTEIRNTMGLLESLSQHGWNVEFSRYQRVGDTWLPGRIKITGHDFKFIFAIKEWLIYD